MVSGIIIPPTISAETSIPSGEVVWHFDSQTMALRAQRTGQPPFIVAAPQTPLPFPGLKASAKAITSGGLELTLSADTTGTISWLRIPLNPSTDRLLWPSGQGVAAPLSDPFWRAEITGQEWPVGEAFSLPAWGWEQGDQTLSVMVASSPFRQTLSFANSDRASTLIVNQQITPRQTEREAIYRFWLDPRGDVLQPAWHYRESIRQTSAFVTLLQKAAQRPEVEKLLGAAHVYLWGSQPISDHDVRPGQWQALAGKLVRESQQPDTFAAHLKSHFTSAQWKAVQEGAATARPFAYQRHQITAGLSAALNSPRFRNHPSLSSLPLNSDASKLFVQPMPLQPDESLFLNCSMLAAGFQDAFHPIREWGGGVSLRMFQALSDAGLDRLKLSTDGHEALALRPWLAKEAQDKGWLIGTYDSYHSIHDPAWKNTDRTWPTAQMTADLFSIAGVINSKGQYESGFQGKGRKLDSLMGSTYMEQRVRGNFSQVPYNAYFVDCDGTGEVYDNFSSASTTNQESDAAERTRRLRWIGEQFRAVVGTEGGNAFILPAVDYAEGIFGPYFGWDMPEMKDPKSPYFRGRYFPPEGPEVYLKAVPLLEKARRRHYDPAVQIPLHTAAFHDMAVITAHWNNAHFKYPEVRTITALREILYLAPPMIHLNPTEWTKRRKTILEHNATWSPVHRKYGFSPMTAFRKLDPAGLVQESVFDHQCRIVVNFGTTPWADSRGTLPPLSARITAPGVWKEPRIYTPTPSTESVTPTR